MRLQLSRLHFPVTTLGVGRRIGVWFQGCSIRCPGCVSLDTWDPTSGTTTVEDVVTAIGPWLEDADGLTISGGEPFDQVDALDQLLHSLRPKLGGDVLVYTGYERHQIGPHLGRLAPLVDVLITGRFEARAGHTLVLRGSDNQEMHLLTEFGAARYSALVRQTRNDKDRALDLVMTPEGDFWFAGIPRPGDMPRLRRLLRDRGFDADTSQTQSIPKP